MGPRPGITCWRLPRSPLAAFAGAASSLTPTLGSKAAIARLAESCQRLVRVDGEVCTDTEYNAEVCSAFLAQIDRCATTLRAKAAPRTYRSNFTVHYRAAVPDDGRHYRVEVLAASLAQHGAIWVNGAKFDFSAEVLQCGAALKLQLASVCALLSDDAGMSDPSSPTSSSGAKSPKSSRRAEISVQIEAFDVAWTRFEEAYIGQLMEIEKSARGLLIEAIHHERCLRLLEECAANSASLDGIVSDEYSEQQRQFFTCLSCLNSVANVHRKGREDLGPEVFEAAAAARRRGEAAYGSPTGVIITEVAESYEAMRDYLRRVEPFLEQVAPRLSENAGLAARLAHLEEGWELGCTYLLHGAMHNAMNFLVVELKAIQRLDPNLGRLCDSCDVEWILALPKLVWLCFLEHPDRHLEVLKSLLPHRFPEGSGATGDEALQALRARFRQVYMTLARKIAVEGGSAWTTLIRWVAFGAEGLGLHPNDLQPGGSLFELVEFLKELETWSMELQRHCPQDWNQCSSLLVRCLTGSQPKSFTEGEFAI